MLPSDVLNEIFDPGSGFDLAGIPSEARRAIYAAAVHGWYKMITRPGSEHVYLARFWTREPRAEPDASGNETLYHWILEKDPGDALHDHPWDFATEVLHGGYIELMEDGMNFMVPRPIACPREHDYRHRILAVRPYTITRVTTGPHNRCWGFYDADGWHDHDQFLTTWNNREAICRLFLTESPPNSSGREALIRRLCHPPTKATRSSRRKSTNSGRSSKRSRKTTATWK